MIELPAVLQGLPVFPCVPGGKLPATPNGWKDASTDPAQIAAWLKINPEFNWAVACGPAGLLVYDIDPGGLDWWHKLLERDTAVKDPVDRTFQVRTPRGGLHVYFRGRGPSTASRIADDIDTRGGLLKDGEIISGGYILLPGSRTANGLYEALPGDEILALPAALSAIIPERKKTDTLGLLKNPDADKPRNISWAIDLLTNYVKSGRVSIQGRGGNDLAFQVAASILDKAISPGMCFDLMWEYWNPSCSPPWDDFELEQIIRNAARYGEDTEGGVKGFQANEDAFASFVGQEFEPPVKEKKSRFKPMWLEEARKDVRPASWLVPGLVPSEGAGILYGQTGSYKTFIALDWALCLAHGIPGQWETPPVKHTVLFLAGESSYALRQERVDAWCAKWGQNPNDGRFILVPGVPSYRDMDGWKEIRDGLLEMDVQPDFVVIDTLTRMMTGMDENSNDDGKLIMDRCEEMAQHYGAFVLGVGHTGKDQARGLRGAQAMQDNSEIVHYAKKTGSGTSLVVKKLKEVDIPAAPFFMEIEKIENSIILNRVENAPAEIQQKAGTSRYDWASVKEVVQTLKGMGGKASTATLVEEIAGRLALDRDLVRRQLLKNDELSWLHPDKNSWAISTQEFDL